MSELIYFMVLSTAIGLTYANLFDERTKTSDECMRSVDQAEAETLKARGL